jgi:hypothetical protein
MSPTMLDSLIADSFAVIEGLSQYDVLALRGQLKRLNLPTYGLKRNLLARLLIYKHGCQKTSTNEPMRVVRARWEEVVISRFIKRSEANAQQQSGLIVDFLVRQHQPEDRRRVLPSPISIRGPTVSNVATKVYYHHQFHIPASSRFIFLHFSL